MQGKEIIFLTIFSNISERTEEKLKRFRAEKRKESVRNKYLKNAFDG